MQPHRILTTLTSGGVYPPFFIENQSAREKCPETEEYFKSAQEMVADSSVPVEMRELGRVLQRIMIGDKNVDLSSLPRKWAELMKRELGG